ncbi:hypothetical protein DERP_008421 [Dermatophagoides pteronyssinus]|uniref:Uncharacterized protein n=1 Tax=Dermatophagoides pteronyssinus TaxID=6956 RepID=A0ABQ8IV88_DERPT|nr:hypothetical protein DERP_008421 [Dermatophagoides pteronyssinus]
MSNIYPSKMSDFFVANPLHQNNDQGRSKSVESDWKNKEIDYIPENTDFRLPMQNNSQKKKIMIL